jgi:thermitase
MNDFKGTIQMTYSNVGGRRARLLSTFVAAVVLALIVLHVFALRAETQEASPGEDPSFRTDKEDFAQGRILVKLDEDTPRKVLDNANRRNDARVEERLEEVDVDVIDLPRDLTVSEAVERYDSLPGVEYAEPDFQLLPAQSTANDPDYPKLYGLNNTGQTGGTSDADIDAPEAWDLTTGSLDTTVAVIDTGVDINHPDLKGNIWTNPDEVAGNGEDDDGNGYVDDVHGWDFYNNDKTVFDAGDGDSHGTHVAGTIAAQGNNSVGVVGVNWQASIMPLKFLGPSGGYTSDAVEAIDYAVAEGVDVSNNSWGGSGKSLALQDAIARADAAGHLFVAAAGNGGSDGIGDDNDTAPSYPASYDNSNIISVAATDKSDALAGFSNFGDLTVDLGAPGVRVLSTLPGNTYGAYSGTSMATPHVTGVAALIQSQSPSLSDAQVKTRILDAAKRVPSLEGKTVTGGRLNAARTLEASAAEVTSTSLSFSASPLTVLFGRSTTLSGELTASGASTSNRTVIVEGRPVGASGFRKVGEVTTGSDGTFDLTGVKPRKNTDYRVRFNGDSGDGLEPSVSSARRVNVRVQVRLGTSTTTLDLGQKRALSGRVLPAHEGSVKMIIKRNGTKIATKSLSLNDSRYRFVYKPSRPGRYTFFTVFPKDKDHIGNRSPARSFKVVR